MIIPDVNLLLYAVNQEAFRHNEARQWLQEVVSGDEPIGLSWNVILAFLRLTTRPGVFRSPLAVETAFEIVGEWLSQPVMQVVHPGPRHFSILRALLAPIGMAGNLTSDAHLAALAIEQNALLCSSDNDFARFSGLNWKNPLAR